LSIVIASQPRRQLAIHGMDAAVSDQELVRRFIVAGDAVSTQPSYRCAPQQRWRWPETRKKKNSVSGRNFSSWIPSEVLEARSGPERDPAITDRAACRRQGKDKVRAEMPDKHKEFRTTMSFQGVRAMKKNVRLLSVVLALLAVGGLPGSAAAFGTDPIAKARTFLKNEAGSSLVLVQALCTLNAANTDTVTLGQNGAFTVTVRYHWSGPDNSKHYTDIHYNFNGSGRLTGLDTGKTSAKTFLPFSVADFGIELLRSALLEELQNLDANDPFRLAVEPYVRQANARSIHLWTLQMRQPR
jgi:hypothetical protein